MGQSGWSISEHFGMHIFRKVVSCGNFGISGSSQVSDVKSLALHVTSINLVSLERGSIVEYVFPCFQLGKLDLGVT